MGVPTRAQRSSGWIPTIESAKRARQKREYDELLGSSAKDRVTGFEGIIGAWQKSKVTAGIMFKLIDEKRSIGTWSYESNVDIVEFKEAVEKTIRLRKLKF